MGIDAPDSGQTCDDGWHAGKMAADYLSGLIHNCSLACDLKQSPSTPGKAHALCKVDVQDLSAAMGPKREWHGPTRRKPGTIWCRNPTR